MKFSRYRHRHGFTLIEVLVAALIMGITVAAISQVMSTGIRAWRNGHGASEIGQTARIAQDMIVRDLDNVFYRTQFEYNKAFRNQLASIANVYAQQYAKNPGSLLNVFNQAQDDRRHHQGSHIKRPDGQGDAMEDFSLASIAPPLNLSFHGSEAQLSFSRGYRPRYEGDQDTWGLRRVTYFVRDKVLYRREADPFGLYMAGETDYSAMATAGDPNANGNTNGNANASPVMQIQGQLQQLFAVHDEDGQAAAAGGDGSSGAQDSAATTSLLPTAVRIEEPLCSGVEIFKIKYGYFYNGAWVEDQNWDSSSRQHRCPMEDDPNFNNGSLNGSGSILNQGKLPPEIAQALMANMAPDDLPGYVAIQLGLRMPNGKGRLYSFTIYHSMPRAQEVDIFREDRGTNNRSPRR